MRPTQLAVVIAVPLACAQCRGPGSAPGVETTTPATTASAPPSPRPTPTESATSSLTRETWSVRREMVLVGPDIGASFGDAVALGDGFLVVGAPADTARRAGAAYLYVRRDGAWAVEQKLTAEDGFAGNAFGAAAAVFGDTVIVGAPRDRGSGAVYVYQRRDGRLELAQKLISDGRSGQGFFGSAVAICRRWIMVGAHGGYNRAGVAYVFERVGETWRRAQRLEPPDDNGAEAGSIDFGRAVAIADERAVATALYTADLLGGSSTGRAAIRTCSTRDCCGRRCIGSSSTCEEATTRSCTAVAAERWPCPDPDADRARGNGHGHGRDRDPCRPASRRPTIPPGMTEAEWTRRIDEQLTLLGVDAGSAPSIDETLRADALAATVAAGPAAASAPPPLPVISMAFPSDPAAAPARGDAGPDLAVAALLGEGGMGCVYSARQRALDRDVAVKLPRAGAPAEAVLAVLEEGRLMGSLEHPNIVPVHALGRDGDGRPLFVMKRVEGVSWLALISDPEHPAWKTLPGLRDDRLVGHLSILQQVSNALHFAHSRGVVHRDVKPENVMIGEFGEVYLLDWGIAIRLDHARDARALRLVGTPAYMAPEMVTGAGVDARTDVYLLGATLHHVLTGRSRHEGAGIRDTLLAAALSEPPVYGASVPAELAALATAATSLDRDARPPSAAAFRDAIAEFLAHRGSLALGAAARERLDATAGLLAGGASRGDADIGHHLAECRFGFQEALRAWPGNEAARGGLAACLELCVDREIEKRNVDAARALLSELPAPRPALEARVAALDAELREGRERERQLDTSVGARSRMLTFGIFLGIAAPITLLGWTVEARTGGPLSPKDMFSRNFFLLVCGGALVGFGRRRLLTNAYNRRLWGLAAVAFAMAAALDLVAVSVGLPGPRTALLEMVGLAGCLGVAALTIMPRLWWAIGAMAALTVVLALMPQHVVLVGAVSISATMLVIIDDARKSARKG